MSHSDSSPDIQDGSADLAAAYRIVQAIIGHHAQLAAGLNERVQALVQLADTGDLTRAEETRHNLLGYLRREILPHAQAEEQALYPPAAALPEGRLLVGGMVEEHHALAALVTELAAASTPVPAAAAARAIAALFAVHLHKENDLVLPLLASAPGVRLDDVLAGMHELVGAEHGHHSAGTAAGGCEGGGCGDGGCGDGGCGDAGCGCDCGGNRDGGDAGRTATPVLSVDSRLDVREVPHNQRHALVLSTVAALHPGQAVVLVAGHAPRPVLAQIDDRFGAQVQAQWLQSGPDVWQIRLERIAASA